MEKKETISPKQMIMILIMFLIGSAVMFGGPREADRDVWLAVLIAGAMSIPVFFIYARLVKLFPEKDLADMLRICFGKILGNIVLVLYVLFAFHLGALVVRNFSEFIQIAVLPETPQFIFAGAMILICIYMAKAGVEVLGRWSTFILPIIIAVVLLTAMLAFGKVEFKYLQPVFQVPFPKLMQNAFAQFSFPFAETVLFLMLFDSLKEGKKPYRTYYISLAVFTGLQVIVVIRNLVVMGMANLEYAAFPSYAAVSIIEIGEFITRIEVIVSVVFLLCGLVKISVCLMAAGKGIARLLNMNTRPLLAPVALLILFFSLIVDKNVMEMFAFLPAYAYMYFPLQVAIPLMLWITAEIRMRNVKKRAPAEAKASP